ncbi:GNAT family N-acetyltransferase [Nonomuraea typhae]|uniref:GNAT family N-acetyltransferase n=1 Tax=Nonomuraea typhae TaxID=2603600 RepID=UPI0012FB9CC4|nr:GNAT family N-acetyltransferase [Nonomuraea typhae]
MSVILRLDPAVVLRTFRPDDRDAIVAAYADPVLRHYSAHPLDTAEKSAEWLEITRKGWESGERMSFAVEEEETGALLGTVVLKRPDPGGAVGEVGYWTAASARGKGLAPRAVELLTGWTFATYPEIEYLELLHQLSNAASCRVAEKTGYRLLEVVPAEPPYPEDGHRHIRYRPGI